MRKAVIFWGGGLIAFVMVMMAPAGYTRLMRTYSGVPPEMAARHEQVDLIRIEKSRRMMTLWREGQLVRQYDISLGAAPIGHKVQEGDERTPEGRYVIDWRNDRSVAHLSLHISYPNADDQARAQAAGVLAGGNIMIHGMLNGWGWVGKYHLLWNWTNGCIAVTNQEMQEIWSLVPDGAVIEIMA